MSISYIIGKYCQHLRLVNLCVLLLLCYQLVEATNYCSVCPNHIACHNNGVCNEILEIAKLFVKKQ